VRRLFGWTAGLVGIAALARLLARRQARAKAPAPAPDPAEELRRKLDESRGRTGVDDTRTAPTSAPPSATEQSAPAEPTETLDERRARVHAKAQEALEAMDALQEPPA
jgi:hypothetical protein